MSTSEASFLDLCIINENKKFKIPLYDKRDMFSFSIVFMPHFDSNIPSNIYYASIGSGILSFVKTTSDINTFVTLSNRLLKRMKKQGSKRRIIISMLNKSFGKHFSIFNLFAEQQQTSSNFFHCFELELYIYTFTSCIVCFCCLLNCN